MDKFMKELYRQGDVLVEAIETIPEGTKPAKTKIVAYGETHGRGHVITGDADVLETNDGLFIDVHGVAAIEHLRTESLTWTEEHHPIPLKQGKYKIKIQREYDPYEKIIRQVRD